MVEAKLLRKKLKNGLIVDKWDLVTIIEKQQAEIDRLNYDLDGFKQNFFVSGFHLQIKMANEQLVKQQEQIDALKSELDRAVELYTDKAIKVEQLEKELTEAGHMIGVLREYISDLENGLDSSIKLNKAQAERNNEPVAWMLADKEAEHIRSIMAVQHDFVPKGCVEIPLYTHPVKELTDEEIDNVGDEVSNLIDTYAGRREFARAILRKAQEK
jgi:hypothetical protein